MPISDRSYMGSYGGRFQWSVTIWILVINAVCFLLQNLISNSPEGMRFLAQFIYLSVDGIKSGYVWQLVTFQFMHASFMHILLNSLGIYFIGRSVERLMPADRYVFLYLFSGLIGGMVQTAWLMIYSGNSAGVVASTVGASAGLFGLIAAFALLLGHETITLMLFFILPVSFQGRYLLPIGLVFSLLGMVGDKGNTGHASHLGGMIGALLYFQYLQNQASPLEMMKKFFPSRKSTIITGTNFKNRKPSSSSGSPTDFSLPSSPPSASEEEINRILDKINEKGIHSLSPEERKKLQSAGSKSPKNL
ncbi:MAG: rhomboid family intramembrane serine protease [Verrucomicrobia bacterium]|nr:rhomboid family intramembrane serine protease [Verrucomicrobiota bacterium]